MIAQADAVHIPLADKSVHCVMTSPPYWGLRKYSGDQGRILGGDPECEHIWEGEEEFIAPENSTEEPDDRWASFRDSRYPNQPPFRPGQKDCISCGAWFGGLGLEPIPEQHVEHIVEICREVKRVLRDDGVFWLNYGDCYSAAGWESNRRSVVGQGSFDPAERKSGKTPGVRAGSLMMMPHRVALALQQDGWIVRQDLVWFKRNPMPESVNGWRWQRERTKQDRSKHAKDHNIKGGTEAMLRDASIHQGIGPDWVPEYEYGDDLELKRGSWRHTRAHEYVFMLVKGMQYWSNQEAVRERHDESSLKRYPINKRHHTSHKKDDVGAYSMNAMLDKKGVQLNPSGRNPRSVLDVPTAPYRGAHYATFPPNLIAPLIRAACPRWACPVCGQGWAAVVDQAFVPQEDVSLEKGIKGHDGQKPAAPENRWDGTPRGSNQNNVLGYRPTCSHEHTQEEAVPGICFDPFVGSGTTVKVAQDLLRRGIGIDISMEYLDQQAKVRAGLGTPSNALEDLPLFENLLE